jgi:signal peptidase II
MVKKSDKLLFLSLVAIAVVFLDQITKILVQRSLVDSVVVIPKVLSFTLVHNQGSFFGMMQGYHLFFIAISIIVIAGIYWFYEKIEDNKFVETMFALILGGATGNLIDRLMVFNIADCCLTIGIIGLVIYYLRKGK